LQDNKGKDIIIESLGFLEPLVNKTQRRQVVKGFGLATIPTRAKKYKVEGIPTKIVIDKAGKIVSINSDEDELIALIEGNL
jgi:hypothetical protein